jgi:type IV secretion system protein VirB1
MLDSFKTSLVGLLLVLHASICLAGPISSRQEVASSTAAGTDTRSVLVCGYTASGTSVCTAGPAPAPEAIAPTTEDDALLRCSRTVPSSTLRAVIRIESNGFPYAIHVNGLSMQPMPVSRARDATRLAQAWIERGYRVDMGLMQVDSANLGALGYTVRDMFDACTNIRAGASILTADYLAAVQTWPEPQTALRAALSAYNTGSFSKGFFNGYVAKYSASKTQFPQREAASEVADLLTAATGNRQAPEGNHR